MTLVIVHTNHGPIKIELSDKTPITTQNFLNYVDEGFYEGTIFHRIIKGFMIQGGGFDASMSQKATHETIKNEADLGLKNTQGTIAMARTPDPDSASSQFFINVSDNGFLDFKAKSRDGWGYCAFGQVVEGLDTVLELASLPTQNSHGHQDVPVDSVIIERIERVAEA